MRNSNLNEHKIKGKRMIPPFMDAMGDKLKINYWHYNRMPEYLWISLIIDEYGRNEGLRNCAYIRDFIRENNLNIPNGRFSEILELTKIEQEKLFEFMKKYNKNYIFDTLTLVCRNNQILKKYFYKKEINNDIRINRLKNIIKKTYDKESNHTTDVKAMIIAFYDGKIHVSEKCSNMIQTLQNYQFTSHNAPEMTLYRSSIRAMEIALCNIKQSKYYLYFWEVVNDLDECNIYAIKNKKGKPMDIFIEDTKKELQYTYSKLTINELNTNKKNEILIGIATYAYKLMNEINTYNLYNTISARLILRTILDCYINIKFLVKEEQKNKQIWDEFKSYGLGQYKKNYKKNIEKGSIVTHFSPKFLELLVNEEKNEEFLVIDFGNFSKKTIRNKAIEIEELDLYETIYEYDTQYGHGYWGAIRESSMLMCNNVLHNYHNVPDFNNEIILPDISNDAKLIMIKIMKVLDTQLEINKEYGEKYYEGNL